MVLMGGSRALGIRKGHVGSRKVVTALLLGVAANTPRCRRDGGVEAEKGGCLTES